MVKQIMREIRTDFLPTRQSLLNRLRRWDDPESWRDFFDSYSKLIYGFARKAGLSDAEAEDAVQETIISVSKRMPDFKDRPEVCSFKGWLRHVAQKRIVDQIRKRSHEVLAGEANEDPVLSIESSRTTIGAHELVCSIFTSAIKAYSVVSVVRFASVHTLEKRIWAGVAEHFSGFQHGTSSKASAIGLLECP